MKFLKGVISEIKMITWLPKSELLKTTCAVLVVTMLITGFVYGVDTLSTQVYGTIMQYV